VRAAKEPRISDIRHLARRVGRRTLVSDARCQLSLSLYPPGFRQGEHSHEQPSLALIVGGSLLEQARTTEVLAKRGWVGVKPDGVRHANQYGPEGAIVLSMDIHSPRLWADMGTQAGWSWSNGRDVAGAPPWPICTGSLLQLIPDELLSTRGAREIPIPAPSWLRRARSELSKSPSLPIDSLARQAGVHRVHLSRSFARFYGESLSLFRLRRRAELALCEHLYADAAAADAAADAGFADQSHFIRTVKRLFGFTPGYLRSISSDVT
jgi:AraC family transcriptional regulator